MQHLLDIFLNAGVVLPAASDDEGGAVYFLLLGPLAGFAYYSMMHIRYRNADKRHEFERETTAVVRDLKTYDQKVSEVKGVTRKQIDNANHNDALQRLGTGTRVDVLPAPKHPVEEMMQGGAQVQGSAEAPSQGQPDGEPQAQQQNQPQSPSHPPLHAEPRAPQQPPLPTDTSQGPPTPPQAPPTPPQTS